MVAYAIDALAWCKANLGKGYYAGGCRCEIPCDTQDCSGWCVAATRASGLWIPCINSAGFAIWGRQSGRLISFDQAIHTPFALLIRGGETGNGPKGHIVPCVGDGLHTYEEMGTRWGACIGTVFNRGFDTAMEVPGLIYGPKTPPPPIFKVKPMYDPPRQLRAILQHPEGKGVWLGLSKGYVTFVYSNPSLGIREGGMTSPADRQDFGNRTLARLKPREYNKIVNGERVRMHGYTIVATDGAEYVPEDQH